MATDFDQVPVSVVKPEPASRVILEPYETANEASQKIQEMVQGYNSGTPQQKAVVDLILLFLGVRRLESMDPVMDVDPTTFLGMGNIIDVFTNTVIIPGLLKELNSVEE